MAPKRSFLLPSIRPTQSRLILPLFLFWLAGLLPAFAADLEQTTKELELLNLKMRQASGLKRVEQEEKLRALAEQRLMDLKTALEKDPSILLRVALSEESYKAMPSDLQAALEHPVEMEGVTDHLSESGSGAKVWFRDRLGHRLTLLCAGTLPPLVPGSRFKVKGIQLDDLVVARCGQNGDLTPSVDQTAEGAVSISFKFPQHGAVLRQTVNVTADSPNPNALTQVSLFRDAALLGSSDRQPFTFSWDSGKDPDGPHTLTLKARNGSFQAASSSVTVTVDNTPPRVTLVSPLPNSNLSGIVSCDADASDVLGVETVKFLVDGKVVGLSTASPYSLQWDTTKLPNGPHAVEAIATDRSGNQTTSQAAPVRVLNANSKPILVPIGVKTVSEGVTLSFNVNATDPNSQGEALTYTAANLPSWAHFDPATHQFSGTPDFTVASSKEPSRIYGGVLFKVCDAQPLCASEEIAITVKNVNRPPTIEHIPDASLREEETLTLKPLVTEPDNDPITCTVERKPAWMSFNAATCSLSGTAPVSLASQRFPTKLYKDVRIQACDPEDSCAEARFNILVRDMPRRSRLEPIGDHEVAETERLLFMISASDPDRDPITLSASLLPDGASFTDKGNGEGVFSWTPAEYQAGTYTVVFGAGDRKSSDEETITITVKEKVLCISGLVQDSIGQGFAGVTVEATSWNSGRFLAVTDEKGFYVIKGLSRGRYKLQPSYRGFNLPSNEGYQFDPYYRPLTLEDKDLNSINFSGFKKN